MSYHEEEHEDLEEDDQSIGESLQDKYMTFIVAEEEYGIPVQNIFTIISATPATVLPHSESYIDGILNLRGSIVPIVNSRKRFHKPAIELDSQACIIVVEHKNMLIGVLVDSIKDALDIPEDRISAPPNARITYRNEYVKQIANMDNHIRRLLDMDSFFGTVGLVDERKATSV